jgi:hypothetical protein
MALSMWFLTAHMFIQGYSVEDSQHSMQGI